MSSAAGTARNRLVVRGPVAALQRFAGENCGEVARLSFAAALPPPAELLAQDTGTTPAAAGPGPREQWCEDNWGTPQDCLVVALAAQSRRGRTRKSRTIGPAASVLTGAWPKGVELAYNFSTTFYAPLEWLRAAADGYPELEFDLAWETPFTGMTGWTHIAPARADQSERPVEAFEEPGWTGKDFAFLGYVSDADEEVRLRARLPSA